MFWPCVTHVICGLWFAAHISACVFYLMSVLCGCVTFVHCVNTCVVHKLVVFVLCKSCGVLCMTYGYVACILILLSKL